MSYVHPAWIEYQRKRFTRHDAHRFIRPDADRFLKPDPAPPRAPEQAGAVVDEITEAELQEYRPRAGERSERPARAFLSGRAGPSRRFALLGGAARSRS